MREKRISLVEYFDSGIRSRRLGQDDLLIYSNGSNG